MNKANNLTKQAMIAAIYTAVSIALSAITFGTVQVRISEALTLLPIFAFSNIWGVTIGCFLTNLIGFFTGVNILGGLDIIFGTLTTFVAALTTYLLRKIRIKKLPILSAIPPILFNAVVIGWELCLVISGGFNPLVFTAQALSVGAGQLISCGVIGLAMVKYVEKHESLKRMIS